MQVIQACSCTGILIKAFRSHRCRGEIREVSGVGTHNFNCYLLPYSGILCQVDCAHAAAAKYLYQCISTNRGADKSIHSQPPANMNKAGGNGKGSKTPPQQTTFHLWLLPGFVFVNFFSRPAILA